MAEKENPNRENILVPAIINFFKRGGLGDIGLVIGTLCTIIYYGYQIFGALGQVQEIVDSNKAIQKEILILNRTTSNIEGKLEIIKVILPNHEAIVKKP